ncbi:MAG: MATE family efflux transporter [Thermoplasmatota archaeon]
MAPTDMTAGPVGPTLRRLAIPMMGAMFAFLLFNLVDTFFVGQLGADELAAMAFTFPVVFVVMSLSAGLGAGGSAVIARAAGQKDHEKVSRMATHVVLLAVVIVLAISMTGLAFMEPLFRTLGADGIHLELVQQYMGIWFAGMAFVVVPMTGNAALRAVGDTKTPARIMIVASTTNLILDPLLIFGIGPFPALGLRGAAIATVIAFFTTFVAAFFVFRARGLLHRIQFDKIWQDWKATLHIAVPAAFTMMLAPLATAVLTRLAAGISTETVAALGVAGRIEGLALLGVSALGAVITPFMGQNLGAQQHTRIAEGRAYANRFATIWAGVAALVIAAAAPWIAQGFTDDPTTAQAIRLMLWLVPITYGGVGMLQLASNTSNGLGRPRDAVVLNVFRIVVAVGLMATLGAAIAGQVGLFIGIAVGNISSGIFAVMWSRRAVATCA